MKRYPFAISLLALLLLAACGGDPATSPITQPPTVPPTEPGGNTISGTLTAPAGGDLSGTIAGACPIVNEAIDCTNSVSVAITQSGASAAYSLDAQPGQPYVIFAFKDVNSSGGEPDNGDYFGGYPSTESATPVTAPASDINITLAVVGGSAPTPPTGPTPPPTPTPPGGGDSISGTVFAIDQATPVSGTVVAACPYVGNNPDCDNLVFVEINASAPSAAYSIDNLAAGQYAVIAIQDYDGDGEFESQGAYAQPVTSPATGIDVQLAPATAASLNISGLDKLELNSFNLNKAQSLLE